MQGARTHTDKEQRHWTPQPCRLGARKCRPGAASGPHVALKCCSAAALPSHLALETAARAALLSHLALKNVAQAMPQSWGHLVAMNSTCPHGGNSPQKALRRSFHFAHFEASGARSPPEGSHEARKHSKRNLLSSRAPLYKVGICVFFVSFLGRFYSKGPKFSKGGF